MSPKVPQAVPVRRQWVIGAPVEVPERLVDPDVPVFIAVPGPVAVSGFLDREGAAGPVQAVDLYGGAWPSVQNVWWAVEAAVALDVRVDVWLRLVEEADPLLIQLRPGRPGVSAGALLGDNLDPAGCATLPILPDGGLQVRVSRAAPGAAARARVWVGYQVLGV